jgi:hypothetical protein
MFCTTNDGFEQRKAQDTEEEELEETQATSGDLLCRKKGSSTP